MFGLGTLLGSAIMLIICLVCVVLSFIAGMFAYKFGYKNKNDRQERLDLDHEWNEVYIH